MSTGSTATQIVADLRDLLQVLIDGGSDLLEAVFVVHPETAVYLASLETSGVPAFPQMGARGGELLGLPCETSVGARSSDSPTEQLIAALDPQRILVADDQTATFSASRATTLMMDDNPTAPNTAVSMLQTHSVAIRVNRRLNFARASDAAVAWMRVAY